MNAAKPRQFLSGAHPSEQDLEGRPFMRRSNIVNEVVDAPIFSSPSAPGAETVKPQPSSLRCGAEVATSVKVRKEYVRTKHRLAWAQWEFDLRDETREREHYWNERDLRRSGGTEGVPQEKFDLLWVEHNSMLTRQLIDAEEAFEAARIAAVNGGCQIDDSDASSVFEDDDNEGYPPSREAVWRADAPKGMIEGWRESIPAVSEIPDTSAASPELDSQDRDDGDLWGSWSVVADPPRQAKIKQWEKACNFAGKMPVT